MLFTCVVQVRWLRDVIEQRQMIQMEPPRLVRCSAVGELKASLSLLTRPRPPGLQTNTFIKPILATIPPPVLLAGGQPGVAPSHYDD